VGGANRRRRPVNTLLSGVPNPAPAAGAGSRRRPAQAPRYGAWV